MYKFGISSGLPNSLTNLCWMLYCNFKYVICVKAQNLKVT